MSKVWLDITALRQAPRPGARLAPLMDCCRHALPLRDAGFRFCYVDPACGFRELSADEARAELDRLANAPALAGWRSVLAALVGCLPADAQPRAMNALRAASRAIGATRTPHPVPVNWSAAVPFDARDVYLYMGTAPYTGTAAQLTELARTLPLRLAPARGSDIAGALATAAALALQGGATYEDRLQHLYTCLLRHGDACIDIGAHTGRHCLPMSVAVGDGGSVQAFEPNPAIAARLRERLGALEVTNVAIHELALSDESGTAEFVVAVDLPEESGLKQRAVYNGQTRTEKLSVQLTQLDAMRLPDPTFIKLDTEGAEYKVLLGGRGLIARARPVIAFEFGEASYSAYGVDPGAVFDYFDALNYAIVGILGDSLGRDAFCDASREQRYWDYVACDRARAGQVAGILRAFAAH